MLGVAPQRPGDGGERRSVRRGLLGPHHLRTLSRGGRLAEQRLCPADAVAADVCAIGWGGHAGEQAGDLGSVHRIVVERDLVDGARKEIIDPADPVRVVQVHRRWCLRPLLQEAVLVEPILVAAARLRPERVDVNIDREPAGHHPVKAAAVAALRGPLVPVQPANGRASRLSVDPQRRRAGAPGLVAAEAVPGVVGHDLGHQPQRDREVLVSGAERRRQRQTVPATEPQRSVGRALPVDGGGCAVDRAVADAGVVDRVSSQVVHRDETALGRRWRGEIADADVPFALGPPAGRHRRVSHIQHVVIVDPLCKHPRTDDGALADADHPVLRGSPELPGCVRAQDAGCLDAAEVRALAGLSDDGERVRPAAQHDLVVAVPAARPTAFDRRAGRAVEHRWEAVEEADVGVVARTDVENDRTRRA